MAEDYRGLTQLGGKTIQPTTPEEAVLERVANPHADENYLVRFVQPEFTSICPITGQPDFAHFVIDYIPHDWLVESKSLKLYFFSFRDHGAFHEACTIDIAKKLRDAIEPRWLRISGYWFPRGGMPIDVFFQTGEPLKDVYIPDTGVPSYRGRG